MSNKRSQEAEESKNEYASQLQNTNQFQRDYYNTNMPQVFQVCYIHIWPFIKVIITIW